MPIGFSTLDVLDPFTAELKRRQMTAQALQQQAQEQQPQQDDDFNARWSDFLRSIAPRGQTQAQPVPDRATAYAQALAAAKGDDASPSPSGAGGRGAPGASGGAGMPAQTRMPDSDGGASSGTEQERAQAVHDAFVARGYPDAQAWGFASNALHESGGRFDTQPGDSGASHGLFQWNGPRVQAYVQRYGHPPEQGSVNEAVDFIDWELRNTEKAAAGPIFAANTPGGAASAISRYFIRPKAVEENMAVRARTADRISGYGAKGT